MSCIYSTFIKNCFKFPDKIAVYCGNKELSYSQLSALVDLWSMEILSRVDGQRPRVALLTDTIIHTLAVSLAVARLGGACSPLNPMLTSEQLRLGCKMSESNVLVLDESQYGQLGDQDNNSSLVFISTAEVTGNLQHANTVSVPDSFSWSGEKDYLLTLSSGSTGDPKPIVISQETKLLRAQQTHHLYAIDEEDIVLCASPFFHSLGQRLVFVALMAGASFVALNRFTPRQWLQAVTRYGVTFTIAVSSHLYGLKTLLLDNSAELQSLRCLVTSSSPIDGGFKKKLFEVIPCAFHEIYGATEIAIATNLYPTDPLSKYKSVGRLCDGVDIRIVDNAGGPVAVNCIGEIACKTPVLFEGYYKKSQLTESAFCGDYFLTGDLGFLDKDNFLYYVSRKKDVIISGGMNIYPQDIESVLLTHSAIAEVSVIGVEDTLFGEVIVAICVSCEGKGIEPELRELVSRQLAAFQRPLKYFFQEELPLTPTGKISKKKLREKYKAVNTNWSDGLRMILYGE